MIISMMNKYIYIVLLFLCRAWSYHNNLGLFLSYSRQCKYISNIKSGNEIDSNDNDSNDRKNLIEALKLLKEKDSKWLHDVVGDSLNDLLHDIEKKSNSEVNVKTIISNESIPSEQPDNSEGNNQNKKTAAENIKRPSSSSSFTSTLKELGYSKADYLVIKDDVLEAIVNKKVHRPKKGLPDVWLKSPDKSFLSDDFMNTRKNPRRRETTNESEDEDIAEENDLNANFKWRGSPITEQEKISAVDLKDIPKNVIDEPVSFWPPLDEFKEMLMDESKFRVNVVGDWTAPFVKAETKWRYRLYKSWLNFLDQGVGDAFDDVPRGFYIDDEENRYKQSQLQSTKEGGRKSKGVSNVDRSTGYQKINNRSNNKDKEVAEKTNRKAKAYEAWIRQQIDASNDWSDISEDEREAQKLFLENERKRLNKLKLSRKFDPDVWFDEDDNNLTFDDDLEEDDYVVQNNRRKSQINRSTDIENETFDYNQAWEDSKRRTPTKLYPPLELSNSDFRAQKQIKDATSNKNDGSKNSKLTRNPANNSKVDKPSISKLPEWDDGIDSDNF